MAARAFALLLVLSSTAIAAPRTERFALVVGSNRGTITDQPLKYAEADAASLSSVLRYMGGFRRGTLHELYTPTSEQLMKGVQELAIQAASAHNAGSSVLIVFYYSGHSDGDALRTGGDQVPFTWIRRALKASGASVRLLVIDACRAGGLTRRKGASAVPPIEVRALGDLATEGEAFIASTTSDELARESALLRGSFFTHHFTSGLRGAADRSGDGKVTLAEAYEYAYARTVLEAVGEQHPTYAFDLTGRGEVVLTSMQAASAALELEPGPERQIIVSDERGGQVVAEAKVGPTAGVRLALPPGRYLVRSGDMRNPIVRSVDLTAGSVVELPAEVAEAARVVPMPQSKGDDELAPTAAQTQGVEIAPMPPAPRPIAAPVRPLQMLIGLGLGTAPVYVSGGSTTEVAWQLKTNAGGQLAFQRAAVDDPGGIATAWLHLRLDVGLRIHGRWDLVASLRAQILTGATAETRGTDDGSPAVGGTSKAGGAVAGLVRARYRFLRGPITPFVELAVGGGEVRPVLDLAAAQTADKPLVDEATARAFNADPSAALNRQHVCPTSGACRDTIRLGPGLAGAGLGVHLEMAHGEKAGLMLSISTTLLGAFGNGNAGLVGDFDLGLLVRFL